MSHKDRLAVASRHVCKNGHPKEILVSLTEAKSKTGEGTAREVLNALEAKGLPTEKLIFQSYDYTTSMSGKFKGAQKKKSSRKWVEDQCPMYLA